MLDQWLDKISALHPARIDLGLTRIAKIAHAHGLTQFSCPIVLVAGTNGKGSCLQCLERIYQSAGYRVAAYYSPHLARFNERICIQGQPVDDVSLIAAFEWVDSIRNRSPLTFFEFTTLAAFHIFQLQSPDLLLCEIGLGGRMDAVNVLDPTVSVVTSIALDHTELLGADRLSIAYEKAGVYRAQRPAICGDVDPPASLRDYAHHIQADFLQLGQDFSYQVHSHNWHWSGPTNRYEQLPLPRLCCQNAATALMAVESLQSVLTVEESALRSGLSKAFLPGRLESIQQPVTGVLDVAHNPEAARCLAQHIATWPPTSKKIAVIAMLKDKDIAGTIQPLLQFIDYWCVAGLGSLERAAHPDQIVEHLQALGVENYSVFTEVRAALQQGIQYCSQGRGRIVVYGSFHTVAAARRFLK